MKRQDEPFAEQIAPFTEAKLKTARRASMSLDDISERSASVSLEYQQFRPADYNKLHSRFLRLAGGEGQSAVEGAITALLEPGLRILDAGAGTGLLARRLIKIEPQIEMTLVDASPRLLHATQNLPIRRIHGDLLVLPLPDRQFDLSLALWVIEATGNFQRTIGELVRVTRSGGHICVLFCAEKEHAGLIDRVMEWSVKLRGTGTFLDPGNVYQALGNCGVKQIRELPCHGPAAAFLVER